MLCSVTSFDYRKRPQTGTAYFLASSGFSLDADIHLKRYERKSIAASDRFNSRLPCISGRTELRTYSSGS